MRVLFLGTPEIAAAALSALLQLKQQVMVVTRPDKPSGRKRQIEPSAVKKLATYHHLPILQPEKVGTIVQQVKEFKPDITICCAYGQLIPQEVLDIPPLGSINIHASLLPKYRGGAPIHWAVINGEKETGITYMYMVQKMDAGPTVASRSLKIGPTETTGELYKRMCALVRESLLKDFAMLAKPNVARREQDHDQATLAPVLKRADEKLDFTQPVQTVLNRVRGLAPTPGAYFTYGGMDIKLLAAAPGITQAGRPGEIVRADRTGVEISCTDGTIKMTALQIPGKRPQELAANPQAASLFEVHELLG